jgi:RES domain-containing protein
VKLYRIAAFRYRIFDATGAALYGGRWNSAGIPVIYTSTSLALARLEKLVQLDDLELIPEGLGQVEIDVPHAASIERFEKKIVPKRIAESRRFGDSWVREKRSLVLLVPSIASDGDWNAIINPAHQHFKLLRTSRVKKVVWDSRLFRN